MHDLFLIFGIKTTRDISNLSQITYNNFEITLVVFMPNITTNHAITYTNSATPWGTSHGSLYREAPPERGTFFRLQVYERAGISLVKIYMER